jgi:valyl-tRNA synthetase
VVWGIRIPAYRCKKFSTGSNIDSYFSSDPNSMPEGSRRNPWFVSVERPAHCQICGGNDFIQDEDTFDTWFSSAQWPFATLLTIDGKKNFYNYFYPTSVMETGYDILPWWVARMIMIGYFATDKVPFYHVFLHGLVRDKSGKKMSKSKGNVINPITMVDKYGADALRAALIFGVKEGNDVVVSEEKIIGMRNFTNKIWNIGRFIWINSKSTKNKNSSLTNGLLEKMAKEFKEEKKRYLKLMENYQFSRAFGLIYDFLWHRLADFYLEKLKAKVNNGNIKVLKELEKVYFGNLIMVHPFMPFVTEAIWQSFFGENQTILNQQL